MIALKGAGFQWATDAQIARLSTEKHSPLQLRADPVIDDQAWTNGRSFVWSSAISQSMGAALGETWFNVLDRHGRYSIMAERNLIDLITPTVKPAPCEHPHLETVERGHSVHAWCTDCGFIQA
jgi:hypothetical protein